MIISLAFPAAAGPDPFPSVTRTDGDLEAPFQRSAEWRARYNLCVADARSREDSHGSLRLEAPEVYCVKYADYFLNEGTSNVSERQTVIVKVVAPSGPAADNSGGSRSSTGGERSSGGTTVQRGTSQVKRPNAY